MKNLFKMTTALLLLAGCMKQEMVDPAGAGLSPVFTASFEDAATKTSVDSDLHLSWTEDDRLSIFTNTYNQQYRFMGKTGDNAGDFEEVKVSGFHSGSDLDRNYAIYPYVASTEISYDGTFTCTLPAVQAYAQKSFGLGANTMVAVTQAPDDYFLSFKNVCGYLAVKLYGESRVRSIELTGNNGEKIAGAATVAASYGQDPVTTMLDTATETITIDCGESGVALGTSSAEATEFWFCIPPTTFSNGFTFTIKDVNGATMTKSVSAAKNIVRNVKVSMAALKVEPSVDYTQPVDLGLSVEWAQVNLGASKPEDYGGYFQWGGTRDVTDKSIYLDWDSCPYHTVMDIETGWTKYNAQSFNGDVDNKTVLEPEDDAAHVNLGDKWRMPTEEEWNELKNTDNCSWTWTSVNGINGYKVQSKKTGFTGNWIFLPAAGCRRSSGVGNVGFGYYWSSSLYLSSTRFAYELYFTDHSDVRMDEGARYHGRPVRPVYGERVRVTGVSLNTNSLSLYANQVFNLTATVTPANATEKGIIWTSSDYRVATVDYTGKVIAVSVGTATITAKTVDGDYTAVCEFTVKPSATPSDPEAVDLGLPSGIKWANCNLGATNPEEYGGYYQWAGTKDVTVMSIYLDWINCPYHTGQDFNSGWSKYFPSNNYPCYTENEIDDKTVLDSEDDVAHVKLGGKWRMPTNEEWNELKNTDNCSWTWTSINGINGYKVQSMKTGFTDNWIFLPAAGYRHSYDTNRSGSIGRYWSSSLYLYPEEAYILSFSSDRVDTYDYYRFLGCSVRPVSE